MESIWKKTEKSRGTKERKSYPKLEQDLHLEAAVIGGGMTGILTAKLLSEAGLDVAVLEADRIGSGQTGNTTAKITSQHGMIYKKLTDALGWEKALHYAAANEAAIQEYRRLVEVYKISCRFLDTYACLYSVEEAEKMKAEAEAAKRLGIDAEFVRDTELPFSVKGAVRFSGQACFHPLEFLYGIAGGLKIFEHTRALSVKGNEIRTEGGTVTADHIVFACHYPFINVPGFYFMRMHQERSYVLALEDAWLPEGMYLGADDNPLSFRSAGRFLLFGGGGHRTGENREGGRYEFLRKKAEEFWPQAKEAAHWSAQDCTTLDDIPYIGKYGEGEPAWYVAAGYKKWGMTSSMAAAMMLRDRIVGRENPHAEIFSPGRFTPGISVGNFLKEGVHAVKGLSKGILALPRGAAKELPVGHGGIVEYEGEKMGVYKDESGELHVVFAKCPHLGCQLEWNPDEKSWDCPCHGSRFDFRGNRLDGPAEKDLEA